MRFDHDTIAHHKDDHGDPVQPTPRVKTPWEIEMERNAIPYDQDVALWHWEQHNAQRPVRCANHLTVYRNTSGNGVTVTDSGLESTTSYRDTFGAHSSRGDVNFVCFFTIRTTHSLITKHTLVVTNALPSSAR